MKSPAKQADWWRIRKRITQTSQLSITPEQLFVAGLSLQLLQAPAAFVTRRQQPRVGVRATAVGHRRSEAERVRWEGSPLVAGQPGVGDGDGHQAAQGGPEWLAHIVAHGSHCRFGARSTGTQAFGPTKHLRVARHA